MLTADNITAAQIRELAADGLISEQTAESACSEITPGWEFAAGLMNGQRWHARERCAAAFNERSAK